MLWVFLVLLGVLSTIEGLDNGLARTPPMGWMHWQRFRCVVDCIEYPDECVSEKLFRSMTDRLVSDGYLNAGYQYIIIDDCWMSFQRDSRGRLYANETRFPNGIKSLSDYVHSKGLRFGIYSDFGNKTCAGYPASGGHLEEDAKTFAEWGVDYLKLDGCYAKKEEYESGYAEMGRYLNQTGRPIVYSCSWPAYEEPDGIHSNYPLLVETCNLWRNWDDIDDVYTNVTNILDWFSDNQDRLAPYHGPGHWNDPDMLIIGNYGLSYEQSKAQMAIWCLMAAPLIMSVDLRTIEPKFRDILLNKEAISINQDPLGVQGKKILTIKNIQIWKKPIQGNSIEGKLSYALGFLSRRVDGYGYKLNISLAELNIDAASRYTIKDVFEPGKPYNVGPRDDFVIRVKPTGVVFLTVNPVPAEVVQV